VNREFWKYAGGKDLVFLQEGTDAVIIIMGATRGEDTVQLETEKGGGSSE